MKLINHKMNQFNFACKKQQNQERVQVQTKIALKYR